jgi:hypothetical protein
MALPTTSRTAVPLRGGTADDVPELAAMLARSFASCPAWRWYLPPEVKGRHERMERFFGFFLKRFYLGGERECLMTADRLGAALVDPPNGWRMTAGQSARMVAAMAPVFRGRWLRAVRAFNALDSGHPAEPHYYLSVLGARPGTRGVAATLLEAVLERCDYERMPAYLETGRPRSRDFFRDHGFEVTEELVLPGGGPPVWRMWREFLT